MKLQTKLTSTLFLGGFLTACGGVDLESEIEIAESDQALIQNTGTCRQSVDLRSFSGTERSRNPIGGSCTEVVYSIVPHRTTNLEALVRWADGSGQTSLDHYSANLCEDGLVVVDRRHGTAGVWSNWSREVDYGDQSFTGQTNATGFPIYICREPIEDRQLPASFDRVYELRVRTSVSGVPSNSGFIVDFRTSDGDTY